MTPVFKGITHDDYVTEHVPVKYQQAFLWHFHGCKYMSNTNGQYEGM